MAAADPPHFEWGVSPAEGVDVETDTGARLVCSWGKPRRRYVWATLHSCQPVEKSPCAVGALFKMHLCEGDMAACPVRKYPPSKWNTEPPACHGVAPRAGASPGNSAAAREVPNSEGGLALASPATQGVPPPPSPVPAAPLASVPPEFSEPAGACARPAASAAGVAPACSGNEGASVAAVQLSQVAEEIAQAGSYADVSAAALWSLMTGRPLALEFAESCLEIPGKCFAGVADAMYQAAGQVRASGPPPSNREPLRIGVGWVSKCDDDRTALHHAASLADLIGRGTGTHFFPVCHMPLLEPFSPHATCDGSRCGGRGFPCSSRLCSNLSKRRLCAWPVAADGDCFPRTLLWGLGAPDTEEARLAERTKLSAFVKLQASRPEFCVAWASALEGLATLSCAAPTGDGVAEGPPVCGPVDAASSVLLEGICNVAGLNPKAEMDSAGAVLGMLSEQGRQRAMGPRPPQPEQPDRRRRGGYRSEKLEVRLEVGRALLDHLSERGLLGKKGRLPRHAVAAWLKQREGREPTKREERAALRHFRWVQKREGASRASGWVCHRGGRRLCRAPSKKPLGRRKKAPLLREMLFQWFCSERGRFKGRILPETLRERATFLRAKYIAEHLETEGAAHSRIDVPKITSHWLRDWRKEFHVSLRSPNKRWKVPRWIWKERVQIYWCNLLRLRRWVYRHKGYDPHIDSWDQKPVHRAEAGSKSRKTLAWTGADVELVENHGHTRERWTAMTMCTTDQLRASAIPPAELLFKGGPIVLGRLQEELEGARAAGLRAARKVTVATSPSASYATAEMLQFMRKHLEPLGPDREWRIASLDVYGPHQAAELVDVCWENGYIGPVLVAPGTTGTLQGNDTHLHGPFSKSYQYDETSALAAKAEADPHSMCAMSHGDCIRCFCSVWDNPDMHKRASAFGVHNMVRGSLDGRQNRYAESSLQELWGELHMDTLKRQCLSEVDELFDRGQLPWEKDTIALLVQPYPKRRCLDVYLPGQEDEGECVDDDGDKPWEDVLPHEDDEGAIVAADEEEVRASGPGPSSANGAEETSGELLVAQHGVSKVESLDIMIEQARASGQQQIQAMLERERRKTMKQLIGTRQENSEVASAVLERLRFDEHERQRREEEARKRKAEQAAARGVEERLREHACRLVLAEREGAQRRAEEERRKAVEDAAVHLEPSMFSATVSGVRVAQKNRWKAFERVMLVGAALSAEQERNLRHDWEKWDAFESHRNPHGNDWANRFNAHLTTLLNHCRNGNAGPMQAWWEHKRRTCVGVHVALPALPP